MRERTGTLAVIAPAEMHAALEAALRDVGAVAGAAEALDAPIAILDATDAKGLEFDHVVVVEPSRLVTPDRAGLPLALRHDHAHDEVARDRALGLTAGRAHARTGERLTPARPAHRGRPSTRSPRMLRKIWVVPPMIVYAGP